MKVKLARIFTQPHWLFVAIAMLFGIIFAYITPPLWGTDETSHFARVYQIANGELLPHTSKANYGGELPTNLVGLNDFVKSDLLDNKGVAIFSRQDVNDERKYNEINSVQFSTEQQRYTWTASYSPFAYTGAVVGSVIADLFNASMGHTIFLARLFSLFVYVALVWTALRLLKAVKAKWLVFVVALTPVSLYQASVVTADNITIGLTLLLVAIVLRLLLGKKYEQDRPLVYLLAIVCALLPLLKINYIFLSFSIFLIPREYFKSGRIALAFKSGIVALSVLLGLAWSKVISVTASAPVSQRPDGLMVEPVKQTEWLLSNSIHFVTVLVRTAVERFDSYLQQMFGLLGWNYILIPSIFIFILLLALFVAAMSAKQELAGIRRQLIGINVLSAAGVAGIFVALYIAFNPVGYKTVDGVQGRYFIPFLVPLVALIATFIPIEIKVRDKAAPYLYGGITVLCLTVSVLYYFFETY